MGKFRRYWPYLFFALLPLLPLWRAVFLGQAIGPFDQIRQMQPWNAPPPDQPWDVLQADGVLQFYPWRDLVFRSYATGHLPLWNPYELAGTPLLANSQSGGFYPPHVLIGLSVVIPTPLGITLLAWFHLAWAGLGVFKLARRLGALRLGAAVGGASFSLSAFMLSWTALPSVIETVSWIPWLLAALYGLFEAPGPGHSRTRQFALLALSSGMMLLAGHLQFCAYGFLAAFLVGICLLIERRKSALMPACLAFLAVGLGVLMSAPQLIPVLDYSKTSHRKSSPSEAGYSAYISHALTPWEFTTLADSSSLGDPRSYVALSDGKISAYWPQLVKPGANFAESAICAGPIVMCLLFFVPWRKRGVSALAVAGGTAFLLAIGTPLDKLLYFGVPGWSSTGSPGRVEVLFVMAACALAALAFREDRQARKPAIGLIGGGAMLLIGVFGPRVLHGNIGPVETLLPDISITVRALVVGAALVAAAAFGASKHLDAKFKAALCFGPVVAAISFVFTLVPSGRPLEWMESSHTTDDVRVAFPNEHWGLTEAPRSAYMPPNLSTLFQIRELGGYDSLLNIDTVQLLKDIDRQDPAPPENGNMMFIKPSADPTRLAAAGTIPWQMPEGIDPSKAPIATIPGGKVKYGYEGTDSMSVGATGPGLLTVRCRNMPGWTVEVDGKPAKLGGTLWREVNLTSGEHWVEFRYRPRGVSLWPVSLLLMLVLLGLAAKAPLPPVREKLIQ